MEKINLDSNERSSFDRVAGHAYQNFMTMKDLVNRLSEEVGNAIDFEITLRQTNYTENLFVVGENMQKALYQFLRTNDRVLEMAYSKESITAIRKLLEDIDNIKIDFMSSDEERYKRLKEVKKNFFVHLSRNPKISRIADLVLEDYWACVVSKRKKYDYVEETMKAHTFFESLVLEIFEIKKNTNTEILSVDIIKEAIESNREVF